MNPSANDRQIGGEHYKASYQHWDLMWDTGAGYFPAQITRYTQRHTAKNGLQDVQKARHYAEKYLELLNRRAQRTGDAYMHVEVSPPMVEEYLRRFFEAHPEMGPQECEVCTLVLRSHSADQLRTVISLLIALESAYPGGAYADQG